MVWFSSISGGRGGEGVGEGAGGEVGDKGAELAGVGGGGGVEVAVVVGEFDVAAVGEAEQGAHAPEGDAEAGYAGYGVEVDVVGSGAQAPDRVDMVHPWLHAAGREEGASAGTEEEVRACLAGAYRAGGAGDVAQLIVPGEGRAEVGYHGVGMGPGAVPDVAHEGGGEQKVVVDGEDVPVGEFGEGVVVFLVGADVAVDKAYVEAAALLGEQPFRQLAGASGKLVAAEPQDDFLGRLPLAQHGLDHYPHFADAGGKAGHRHHYGHCAGERRARAPAVDGGKQAVGYGAQTEADGRVDARLLQYRRGGGEAAVDVEEGVEQGAGHCLTGRGGSGEGGCLAGVDGGAPFVAEVGGEAHAEEHGAAVAGHHVFDGGGAVGVAGLDKDDFLAGTGFECAGEVEFGVGGEDADGLLETCHLAPGYHGGRCVGFAREAHAPGQVAYLAHQGQKVFAACSDEYGLRDEWLFDQDVAAAEFFAHGLYGVKEFGRGMDAGYYALLQLVEAHAAAHAQHIPAGLSLCEQLFDFALGAWVACARGHGGGTRGQRVGGACGELCLSLGGCGAAAHGHGCPERAGKVAQADVAARRQVAEVSTEAFGEVGGYLTRCAVGLPQVEDVFATRRCASVSAATGLCFRRCRTWSEG